MQKKILALLLAVVGSLAIAACGSSSDSSTNTSATSTPSGGGGGASTAAALKVTAASDGSLAWSPTKLSAKAGPVTLELENPAPTPHNIQIEGETGASDTISGGDTTSVTATLKPGTYTYFCDIPGHRPAGMEGTLTVK